MEKFIKDLPLFFFTQQCLKEYIDNFNFLHIECFKATLSKFLGLGIIAGSLMVKVPQIIKILQNKSAKGINVISVLMELFTITATLSYSYISGFPFSSYGDSVFLALQTVAIAYLITYYIDGISKATAFLAVYVSIITAVFTGLTPLHILWGAQASNIPVNLFSKLMQAYTNYTNGSTGQLSAVTIFMLFFGSIARIFTSIQETGDTVLIMMYICSTLGNAVLVGQLIYYWNVDKKVITDKKKL